MVFHLGKENPTLGIRAFGRDCFHFLFTLLLGLIDRLYYWSVKGTKLAAVQSCGHWLIFGKERRRSISACITGYSRVMNPHSNLGSVPGLTMHHGPRVGQFSCLLVGDSASLSQHFKWGPRQEVYKRGVGLSKESCPLPQSLSPLPA